MEKIKVKIKKLKEEATIPCYAHPGDAGLDLFSCENYVLKPGERHNFLTGISIELPEGYVSLLWDKSGLAANKGLTVLAGVIEHTYRGEYGVVLLNTSDKNVEIKKGQKIAQLLVQPIATAEIEIAESLSETPRGKGAWGSTGD